MSTPRRAQVAPSAAPAPDPWAEMQRREEALRPRRVGLALSGGGIRSATFNLGILQGLAGRGLLGGIDVLSTVSGGGYIGSFFGRLFQESAKEKPGADVVAEVARRLREDSEQLRYLRNNGRYLAPNGSGDLFAVFALVLRNWVSVHVVLGVFLMVFVLAWTLLGRLMEGSLAFLQLAFSPTLALPLAVLAVVLLPLGWAYWIVRGVDPEDGRGRLARRLPLGVAFGGLALGGALGLAAIPLGFSGAACWACGALAALCLLELAWYGAACLGTGRRLIPDEPERLALRRERLTAWFRLGLVLALGLLALALLDGGGRALRALLKAQGGPGLWRLLALLAGFGASVAAGAQKWGALLSGAGKGGGWRLPLRWLVQGAAILLCVAHLCALFTCAQALHGASGLLLALGAALLLSWIFGAHRPFLNESGHASFYTSRLARAFLGAANPVRTSSPDGGRLTRLLPGDDLPMADYAPHRHGGPIHLVNVTVNETVDGESQVQQQDLKGTSLAIGPAGISVGVRHHAPWVEGAEGRALRAQIPGPSYGVWAQRGVEAIHPEPLSLGRWVAISGAAFNTGTGYRTYFGLSLLCGWFNVRLGHWFFSGVDPRLRTLLPRRLHDAWLRVQRPFFVQLHLLREFLASFPGTSFRHWFLSDGGHFENTGAYELLRRRLPFIVLCDASADPDSGFEDLARLVRKARTNFRTEIRFRDRLEVSPGRGDGEALLAPTMKGLLGPLAWLRRGQWRTDGAGEAELVRASRDGHSLAYAALADLHYPPDAAHPEGSRGTLLYVKAGLKGDEDVDLLEYHGAHPDFPHQSTADQFFDEAQWESHRRLGETVARRLFAPCTGGWCPHELRPLA